MHDEPSNAPPSLPFTWGALRVIEKLGSGRFRDVFRAHDPVLNREVALKLRRELVDPTDAALEAHLAEARRLARLRHPNVVTVHGVEVHQGRIGMWTDLLHGRTLEERIAETGPLDASELARIGVDLCQALSAIHAAGLIHNDLAPANVMLERSGRAILMDFGSGDARTNAAAAHPRSTVDIAPETLAGQPPSIASDLYALAALLQRIQSLEDARADLPPELARVIRRALAADPMERPASASEMEMALTGALADVAPERALEVSDDRPARFGTRFVGRRNELMALRRLLSMPGLITLLGAGGCGKTRLAHRVAIEIAYGLPDGILWVELAGLRDDTDLPRAIADALVLREERDQSIEASVIAALAPRTALLVLDNCEHLAAGVAHFVSRVLAAAPRMRILATSRRPLGLPSEQTFRVPSLSLPALDSTNAELTGSDSVRLFLDRARRRVPDFALTEATAPAIARIVRRMDGIPLAIELAAARVGLMSADDLADRLDGSWRLLAAPSPSTSARQQTLRASIDWSYRLLDEPEAMLLDRLSAFAAGFTLAHAEAIVGDPSPGPRDATSTDPEAATVMGVDLPELLARLVDASLVQLDDGGRYRLLEMVRSFAAERLDLRGETARLQNRLARRWIVFLDRHRVALSGSDATSIGALHDAERDNLRASLNWTATAPREQLEEPDLGLTLALESMRYFETRGHFTEALYNLERHQARLDPDDPVLADAITGIGALQHRMGRLLEARRTFERAAEFHRAHDSLGGLAVTLSALGNVSSDLGDHDAALGHLAESLRCFRAIGHEIGANGALCTLGMLETRAGNLAQAEEHFQTALEGSRAANFLGPVPMILRSLSRIALRRGDLARARALGDESLALLRRSGGQGSLLGTLHNLAEVAIADGAFDEARALLVEALEVCRAQEQLSLLPSVLSACAELALQTGDALRTARLLGALEVLCAVHQLVLPPFEQAHASSLRDRARSVLGADDFIIGLAAGRAMSREQIYQIAAEAS